MAAHKAPLPLRMEVEGPSSEFPEEQPAVPSLPTLNLHSAQPNKPVGGEAGTPRRVLRAPFRAAHRLFSSFGRDCAGATARRQQQQQVQAGQASAMRQSRVHLVELLPKGQAPAKSEAAATSLGAQAPPGGHHAHTASMPPMWPPAAPPPKAGQQPPVERRYSAPVMPGLPFVMEPRSEELSPATAAGGGGNAMALDIPTPLALPRPMRPSPGLGQRQPRQGEACYITCSEQVYQVHAAAGEQQQPAARGGVARRLGFPLEARHAPKPEPEPEPETEPEPEPEPGSGQVEPICLGSPQAKDHAGGSAAQRSAFAPAAAAAAGTDGGPLPQRQWSAGRQGISPSRALRYFSSLLTGFEKQEVMSGGFPQVWFCGRDGSSKVSGRLGNEGSLDVNHADDRGDYLAVKGDHIAYRFEVLGLLGRGSFGQVLHCHDHATGRDVALKIVRCKRRFQRQAAVEVSVLQQLRDQRKKDPSIRVVRAYESFSFRGHLCITFEVLWLNLYELLKAGGFEGTNPDFVKSVARQVLGVLRVLRGINLVHCDIKPENILLESSSSLNIKVIDFGSACHADKRVFTYVQSRFYRSPEVLLGLEYGPPIDMWSLGCVLAELHTGSPLFPGDDEKQQMSHIAAVLGPPPTALATLAPRASVFFDGQGVAFPVAMDAGGQTRLPGSSSLRRELGPDTEPLFLSFLGACLHWEANKRLIPDQALEHPWLL